ncbi:hypothetical protein LKD70_09185 [Ruminococcus sp. CLA-AA-H200]|uniref:Uncharacterized protein n=1 Tax=Ruminococcus turbiniformis TaxID=2881258 RepID=A0ABS8FX92_9FIRM|nr:hypothetical protein [Ruminococcus turbiniformis]MCC2254588.1 hypothetical protein [Ruminococcus turbiniformis]
MEANTLIQGLVEDITQGNITIELYFVMNLAIFLLVAVICSIIGAIRKRRMENYYVRLFEEKFDGNLRSTFSNMLIACKKHNKIRKAIRKAIFYLDHSIARDYAGALRCINHDLDSRRIKKLHKEIFSKIKVTYLLTQKEDNSPKSQEAMY